jgi:ABC-2 type transport system permease protein
MEFRIDFFFRVVMDILFYGMNISFFKVLYRHTDMLGGWNEQQVMIFVAAFMVLDGLQMTLFSNNLFILPGLVNRGDLDYYLVRPVSPMFFLALRDFAANSFLNLIMAVAFFGYVLRTYSGHFSFGDLGLFTILFLNGILLYFYMRLLSILPVFWTQSRSGLDTLFWNFTRFIERPDRIFTGLVRIVLLTVMPFGLMVSVPTRVLLGEREPTLLISTTLTTFVFTILIRWLWASALRNYSSASS